MVMHVAIAVVTYNALVRIARPARGPGRADGPVKDGSGRRG